jgi:glycosyltransferase involved in cell wall biosynthesis
VIPEKGAHLLIEAALRLYKSRRFKLRIVGSSGFCATDPLSGYEIELRKLAAPLGSAVEFAAFVDRHAVLREYQAASIFCVPSNWDEPVSLTVSEAMACGVATIAARRGGIPEAGGDAVLYFSPPDVNELSKRLAYLIDDESARGQWGAKGRSRALSISWEQQYRKYCSAIWN